MPRSIAWIGCVLAIINPSPGAEPVDYVRDVRPILRQRCYSCHGALKQKSALRLDTAASIRKGGKRGPAIAVGRSAESVLVTAVTGRDGWRMPPEEEGAPLSEREIAILKQWIDQGAKAPQSEEPEQDSREHWAFRPPVRRAIPKVPNTDWVRNPIDAFIAQEHQRRGLQPSPPAPKHVLLRRVTIDLTGLPPTREELHAFLADNAPDAYERVVDRLLASAQHAERWARHWMDVWRYSDWYGRRTRNDVRNSYPHIWRWRDWIVRSLATGKGYDRMITEMLAADEVVPEDDTSVVATGFLVRSWYKLNYNIWMKDLVEHTSKAFLGLTVSCAMCHDHKYDPITQQEYFRFRAFFEPLELRQDRVAGLPDPGPYDGYNYGSSLKPIEAGMVRAYDKNFDAKTYMVILGDERNRMTGTPPVQPGVPASLGGERVKIQPVNLPAVAYYPGLKEFVRRETLRGAQRELGLAKAKLQEARGAHDAAQEQLAKLVASTTTRQAPEQSASTGTSATSTIPADVAEHLERAKRKARDTAALLELSNLELAESQAKLRSVEARLAADRARYGSPERGELELGRKPLQGNPVVSEKPGKPEPATLRRALARAASRAEREFKLRAAQTNLLRAQQQLTKLNCESADRPNAKQAIQKAQEDVLRAQTQLDSARKPHSPDSTSYTPLGPTYNARSTGRRRALAQWIASRNNPLTARVALNHIWLRHIGSALVTTVYDFGRNGNEPTHPELLDWLAVEFMESGWSTRAIHRLIVTSSTYRMQSRVRAADEPNLAIDRENRYLWRMNLRRMEAEVVRDSLLLLGGQLDLTMGGQELDFELGETSRRRSMYFTHHAEGRMQFLKLFDAPDPSDCYRRTVTIVPQQALAMANSAIARNQSRLLARRLSEQVEGESAFIIAAFEQILSRTPSGAEQTRCREFLQKQRQLVRSVRLKSSADKSHKNTVVPSANPLMRAKESLVHVLFSHNDFVTIR